MRGVQHRIVSESSECLPIILYAKDEENQILRAIVSPCLIEGDLETLRGGDGALQSHVRRSILVLLGQLSHFSFAVIVAQASSLDLHDFVHAFTDHFSPEAGQYWVHCNTPEYHERVAEEASRVQP